MAGFIGNTPAETYVSLETQNFTTSATASYTLSNAVTNENEIALFINNVRQQPGSSYAYTASGTTLTLSSATAGTDTMYCVYLGKSVGTINPPDGSVGTAKIEDSAVTDAKISGLSSSKLTGALPAISGASLTNLPSEITKQSSDPTVSTNPSGGVGSLILNTSTGKLWACIDATAGANVWKAGQDGSVAPAYNIDYLVIAGGGGGGGINANGSGWNFGGGGAGGYRASWNNETSGGGGSSETAVSASAGDAALTITIGAGGAGGYQSSGTERSGADGSDSVFATITSTGGGGTKGNTNGPTGYPGGSGGGGGADGNSAGGAGTANQGYAGGTGSSGSHGGGGGGAGEAGNTDGGGHGGDGVASTITGSSVVRAGGGSGGSGSTIAGGDGGGGAGKVTSADDGTVNTGGGGGGNANNTQGGNGGSGVVILRMATADYSGTTSGSPTVTTSGSDTILTFNSSGSYTP